MLPNTEYETIENKASSNLTDDYAQILESFGLLYKKVNYYLQVGEITKTEGWILHISVVLSQIRGMLETIIPFLIEEKATFKIIMNELTSEDLLDGNLGLAQIGKIVKVYPENDANALNMARKLIELTKLYKGPRILTDICLGNIVYTRYGSFNPVIKLNANGNEEKYIYDGEGELIKDSYAIPFQIVKGVLWPFKAITDPILPGPPKLLNHLYKLVSVLKTDPRGNVFKGLYLKSLLQVKHCVIKQGFINMSSDMAGRDIQDRLIWQNELYKELSDIVPMPVIYDLFREQGFTMLVMKFIRGDSLYDKLITINPLSKSWLDLPPAESVLLLQYIIEITSIISRLHKRGYVHRDVVPVNFLINKKDRVVLIDIELAYSLKHNTPEPPFKLGTPGFMSPEQEAIQRPTTKEDVYGLGATMLYLFTGIFPVKFNKSDTEALAKGLTFFIDNEDVAKTIADSLHTDPKFRPAIINILKALRKYQKELKIALTSVKRHSVKKSDTDNLKQIISSALEGITSPPLVVINDLWYSKLITIENFTAPKNKEYAITPGMIEGISGVLYMLARVNRTGISIDPCKKGFRKNWELLETRYLNRLEELPAGLYKGAAGFALALAEGIRSELLEDNAANRGKILRCLSITSERMDLADGITGQAVSILQCKYFLQKEAYHSMLEKIVGDLLSRQQKDGAWLEASSTKKGKAGKILNIAYDDTGIIWLLLEYLSLYPTIEVQTGINKALHRILSNKMYLNFFYNLVASKESYELGDGGKGLIVTLIKAYETFHEDVYKKMAEKALFKYPPRITHHNFNQESGLAAIGELYLEAWRVFKNEEWKDRAHWIANVFIHCFFRRGSGSGYWVMEQNNPPTADLMGNSGIIHFLVRCLDPELGYRLLK